MKAAIVILSDPKGGEDAAGRAFNGLGTAYELKRRGDDVTVVFQGAGTRWASALAMKSHPFNGLFELVKDKVAGVSCGCADVFGARQDAENAGFKVMTDNQIPGTSGTAGIGALAAQGYTVLTF
jgi:hypothetical protein